MNHLPAYPSFFIGTTCGDPDVIPSMPDEPRCTTANFAPKFREYGGELSAQQKLHAQELRKILKNNGTAGIRLSDLEQLVHEIGCQCPWYPEEGTLDLRDWIKIGNHLHSPPRAPIQHLLLWQKCKEAIEVMGTHKLKAPSPSLSLLPEQGSAPPPPYFQLTLLAATTLQPVESSSPTASLPIAPSQEAFSVVRAGFQEKQQKGTLTGVEIAEGLQAFPVTQTVNPVEKFATAGLSLLIPPPLCYSNAVICPLSSPEDLTLSLSTPTDTDQITNPSNSAVQSSFQMVESCKRDSSMPEAELGNFTRGLLEGIENEYTMIPEKLATRCGTHPEPKGCLSRSHLSPSRLPSEAPAIADNAGLDLTVQESVEFKFPLEVKLIPSQFKSPLLSVLVGLILPHSSAHKKGYFVVPGVIDSDYTGTLFIQAWVTFPQTLSANFSIAQLLLIVLSPATLTIVSECAFLKVSQAGKPRANFSNIRQGDSEPYVDFVERLSKAVHQQFDHQETAGELLGQLAIENANADRKQALQSLKATNQYTLADMLKACADIGTNVSQMDALAAAAIQKGQRPAGNCFKCGKPGHFQKDCLCLIDFG